jgi:hypothetical protein
MVGGGDHPRGQPGVAEPLFDEAVDASQQAALPAVRRHHGGAVQPRRQRHREQVQHGRAEPEPVGDPAVVQVPGQLAGERGHQRAGALVAGDPDPGQPLHLVLGQRQQRAREQHGDQPRGRVGPAGGP